MIIPEGLGANEPKPSAAAQKFILVLTGVGIVDLQGNNSNERRRETLTISPDIANPLGFASSKYGIPRPANTMANFDLEQWAPYANVSSAFEKENGGVDLGFAVDVWRPHPFFHGTDTNGQQHTQLFQGVDVDVAIRNKNATLHRVNYHVTLVGRIVFLPNIIP